MLDINYILENKEKLEKVVVDKCISLSLNDLISKYEEKNSILGKIEVIRARRNEIASSMKSASDSDRPALIEEGKKIKEEITALEPSLKEAENEFKKMMYQVPNIVDKEVPVGKDDGDNVVLRTEGEKPEFNFKVKDHIELMENCDLVDFDRGVKVHGFRGYFLKNAAVLLQQGVMQLALNKMVEHGFTLMTTPAVVREKPLYNSGHFPGSKDEIYKIENSEDEAGAKKESKYVAGTAEVSLMSCYADETFEKKELPLKICGISPCFRSEVGSYGKDSKGLYRIHEFTKVEQIVLCEDSIEESKKMFSEMLSIAEEMLSDLGLCYQVMNVCTGDMGAGKYYMNDIETWMPGRGDFGETHSCSNLLDWQTRRANIKYTDDGEKKLVYGLNNTVIASPRILVAIVENYQNENGSITVPEILRPYVGMDVINPVK